MIDYEDFEDSCEPDKKYEFNVSKFVFMYLAAMSAKQF